jgi:hypothetical protein
MFSSNFRDRGTIMHNSKLPLLTWFWAIYLVVHDKRGKSALALSDVLEINYRTALRLLRKIREAMRAQDANYQLSGSGANKFRPTIYSMLKKNYFEFLYFIWYEKIFLHQSLPNQ